MFIASHPTRYRRLAHGPQALAALHDECLELFARATELDAAQRLLAAELGQIRTELAARRVVMWPQVDRKDIVHGFRYTLRGGPPPIPPVAAPNQPLAREHLRSTVLAVLARSQRPMSLTEIHREIHLNGYSIASRHPVQRLADCLAYEVTKGRARRTERGIYELGELSPGTRRRIGAIPISAAGSRQPAYRSGGRPT